MNNCGGCGIKCEANNANVACVNSACVITTCQGSYADCDKATANGFKTGCEVDTNLDTNHCGGCGKPCTIANGTPKCDAGSCEVKTCSGTFDDCDGDPKTGCEVNIAQQHHELRRLRRERQRLRQQVPQRHLDLLGERLHDTDL